MKRLIGWIFGRRAALVARLDHAEREYQSARRRGDTRAQYAAAKKARHLMTEALRRGYA
jgi:hypothetical protein